jgi:hypothetical protein
MTVNINIVNSVQIDMHPDHANIFLEMIEEWHDNKAMFYEPQTQEDKFSPRKSPIEQLYHNRTKKLEEDKVMRLKHPILAKMWAKYKTMMELLKNEE